MNARNAWLLALSLLMSRGLLADSGALKVFVLVGQSNMQGHARVRTLEHIGMSPNTAPVLEKIVDEQGTPRVFDEISIAYLSNSGTKQGKLTTGYGADEEKIGPELTFGIYTQQALAEPILLIKAAWGGKSLHTDFRPPSAGAYEFDTAQIERFQSQGKDIGAIQAEKIKATGHYYRLTLEHIKNTLANIQDVASDYDPAAGYELAGFVWFQGWNDMVDRGTYPNRDQPGGYDDYSEVLKHFIRDIRKDLQAPQLPFVIGVLGVNGPTDQYTPNQQRYKSTHQNFRDAMAAPAKDPEFEGNVFAVLTEQYWDQELTKLRTREAAIKQEVKQLQNKQGLGREQAQKMLQELKAKEFTELEAVTLEKGVSNQEYHYLGSAKIMAQIGKGFAEALNQPAK